MLPLLDGTLFATSPQSLALLLVSLIPKAEHLMLSLEECELSSWLLSWPRHAEGLSIVLKMTPFHPSEGSSQVLSLQSHR